MKYLILSCLSSALVASAASTKSSSYGAVYTMSNEPTGNYIIAHNIMADGTIAFAKATYAGGIGYTDFTAPDGDFVALFSSSAVEVVGNYLFAVNAGSNTVSMFAIDPLNPPNLTMLGKPVDSGGDFPVSVDVSPTSGHVCVLNAGVRNGVSCFSASPKTGLSVLRNTQRTTSIPQTNPPLGPTNTASHVLFSEDGKRLSIAVKGDKPNNTPGYIASWSVANDGSLSENFVKVTPGAGGFDPFGMMNIPNRNAIVSTDPGFDNGPGLVIYDFEKVGPLNATNQVFTIPGQSDTCWVLFSPRTKSGYTSDRVTSLVNEISIDSKLQVTNLNAYALTPGSALLDLGLISLPKNDYLYVLSANITSIDVLRLDAPGKAEHVQKFNVNTTGVIVSPGNIGGIATFLKPN